MAGRVGHDFSFYMRAGVAVAHGHSPYRVADYVYPPFIATLLAPFSHVDIHTVWKVWTAGACGALVVVALLVVLAVGRALSQIERPVLFGIAGVSALHFWPTTVLLELGQADTFVLALLALSVLASERGRSKLAGVFLGLAGLAKAWPGAAVVAFFRKHYQRRWPTLIAFVITVALAPVLALALGGASELSQLFRAIFNARSQHLVSDSVWGIPSLNFSHSGLAHPLFVSLPLQVVATVALLGWVVTLMIVTLHTDVSDPVLPFWNVVLCVVVLLPVSHLAYAIMGLPLLWSWIGKLMERSRSSAPSRAEGRWRRPEGMVVAVTAILVLWWVILNKTWPDNGSSAAISSLRYSVVFGANLVAVTASVFGVVWLGRHSPTATVDTVPSVVTAPAVALPG
ncbi:MAG TPA: glycosyltransferase family 87 protein [Acidimicrobiales bacterium]